jgi:hypothetical protein
VASDLGLGILWTVDANGLYHAHWEVPLGAAAGKYRFVITANRYGLKSKPFAVRRSRGLTIVPVSAGAGRVGVELRYPEPTVREAVGDPPGDVTASLTARPAFARAGRATFRVGRRAIAVRARPNGVFSIPAKAGAKVKLRAGDVTDSHGNANGNALTLKR